MLKKIRQRVLRPRIGRPVMLTPLMRELGKTLPLEDGHYILSGDADYVAATIRHLARDYRNATRGVRGIRTSPKPASPAADPAVGELAAQRLAVCEKCSDSVRRSKCNGQPGGVTCRLMFDGHYTPCQFAAYLKRPSASCPKQTTQQWGV